MDAQTFWTRLADECDKARVEWDAKHPRARKPEWYRTAEQTANMRERASRADHD
jgi:hypothetical protein